MNNYDLARMRIDLIDMLVGTLNKQSKYFTEDREQIIKHVNKMTRAQLIESLGRQKAVSSVTKREIYNNCKF